MKCKGFLLFLLAMVLLPLTTTAQSVYPKGNGVEDLKLPSKIGQIYKFNKQFERKKIVTRGFEITHDEEKAKKSEALYFDVPSAFKLDLVERKQLKNWVHYVLKHNRDWGVSRGHVLSAGKVVLIKATSLDRDLLGKKLGVLEIRMLAMSGENPLYFYNQPEHIVWVGVLDLKTNGQVEKTLIQYKGLANIDHDGINDYSIVGLGKRKQDESLHLLINYQGYYAHTQILLNMKDFTELRYSL